MAIFSSGASCVLSSILTLLLFSAMQMYKPIIATSAIWGGFMGSLVFFFALTALANAESTLFRRTVHSKLFPEVAISLFIALLSASLVHRVAVTTCLMFSIFHLYFINTISQKTYSTPEKPQPAVQPTSNKRKNK